MVSFRLLDLRLIPKGGMPVICILLSLHYSPSSKHRTLPEVMHSETYFTKLKENFQFDKLKVKLPTTNTTQHLLIINNIINERVY